MISIRNAQERRAYSALTPEAVLRLSLVDKNLTWARKDSNISLSVKIGQPLRHFGRSSLYTTIFYLGDIRGFAADVEVSSYKFIKGTLTRTVIRELIILLLFLHDVSSTTGHAK